MKKELKIIDLYCGCGGFGLGAELAGYHSVVAVDVDETLQSAYRKNFPNTKVVQADLAQTDQDFWSEYIASVEIDGVIGGPPCQGYSRMGVSDKSDPRRSLLRHFFRNVNIIQPKFFIMENVEGLLDGDNKDELNNALKIVDKQFTVLPPVVVDASNLGAPTRRKRVMVVGYLRQFFRDISVSDILELTGDSSDVNDAIGDLASPIKQTKNKNDYGWGEYAVGKNISSYAKYMRTRPPEGIGSSDAKAQLINGRVSGFFETVHNSRVVQRYSNTLPGKVDSVSRAKRLEWNGLCPTLRAGTGADKGSHQAVRPIHPEQGRVITVREAARLQGFPDWFLFHPTKWHSFRMIGNSVSPIVSRSILQLIKDKLICGELLKAV